MDRTPLEILREFWGYDSFRELQQEIIDSVLGGCDTLGLLPTGGGKSLTFQVPALINEGVTLVVTPLISLMKDQVDNLRERGIRAVALYSGLTMREQRFGLERCRLEKAKLLYVSPEKLQSKSFIEQLNLINVTLIVVDEAHCISQWGYDFRPSYLKIAALRKLFPEAPVLALTASATPEVAEDIMKQLEFRSHNVFMRSFHRENISYLVRHVDHKDDMLLRVLKNTRGCAIVYVRSRKRTREIAEMLNREHISADYYHAGLAPEEKVEKQNSWKDDRVRVMVATNAFGMGIDKADVRTVVHYDPPSSLEEYYQEAGRAGRDGKPSYAVILASNYDKGTLTRRINETFPPKDYIRRVYELAGNFLEVAVGSGYNNVYEFNFPLFCERFKLQPNIAHNALMLLSRGGYMEYVDDVSSRARVMVLLDKRELYSLRLDAKTDAVLQILLRTYTGLFSDYVQISESLLARRLNVDEQTIYEGLLELGRQHAVHYIPRRTTPYVVYTTSRELPKHVVIPRDVYEVQRERMQRRVDAMKRFIFDNTRCRVEGMLKYFGDKEARPCGSCDMCRDERNRKRNGPNNEQIEKSIVYLASQPGGREIDYIAHNAGCPIQKLVPLIRKLIDEGVVELNGSRVVKCENGSKR